MSKLTNNTTNLQNILEAVNDLPSAGSGENLDTEISEQASLISQIRDAAEGLSSDGSDKNYIALTVKGSSYPYYLRAYSPSGERFSFSSNGVYQIRGGVVWKNNDVRISMDQGNWTGDDGSEPMCFFTDSEITIGAGGGN